jgi:carbamoyl-phosphate synthase small subunit
MAIKKKSKALQQARGDTGFIALANGVVLKGKCLGALRGEDNPVEGELVFNTSMYGYQEILTDPSYAGQIMTFTYPHIGNVGCNEDDVESSRVYTEGLVVRAAHKQPSNFRATISLQDYLAKHGVMGIEGVDTRELVTQLRTHGSQMAVMAGGENVNPDTLVDKARALGSMEGKDYVRAVACKEIYTWDFLPWSLEQGNADKLSQEQLVSRPHAVAIDCGVKTNILRLLVDVGFRVTVVPAGVSISI